MASQTRNKQALPVPVVVGAVVLLVALAAWLAYINLRPTPLPPEKASPNASRIMKIYTDSGGDWNKVSPADQQWIHQFSGGKETMAWASLKARKSAQP